MQVQTELPKLLDAEQVSEILGQDPRTILNAVRDGRLTAVRLGHRTIRFRREDLDAYISAHRTVAS